MALWGAINHVPTAYAECSIEEFTKQLPAGIGEECAEAAAYTAEFGWDGGEPGILRPKDVSTGNFVTHSSLARCHVFEAINKAETC